MEHTLKGKKKQSNMVLLGDMNIGYFNCNEDHPTREDFQRGSATNIDHIIFNIKKLEEMEVNIINTNISDHYSLYTNIVFENNQPNRNINNYHNEVIVNDKVNRLIQSTDWDKVSHCQNDPDIILQKIQSKFSIIYSNSKKCVANRRNDKNVKWLDQQLMKLCKERDQLYKRWRSSPNNTLGEAEYKRTRNNANKKILLARNNYYKNEIQQNRTDIRKT